MNTVSRDSQCVWHQPTLTSETARERFRELALNAPVAVGARSRRTYETAMKSKFGCSIAHGLRNLTKRLAAGCDFALLVSTDDETLSLAARYLDDSDDRLKCVTPNQFIEFLNGLDHGAKSQSDWMETKRESTRTDGGRPFVEMAGKHVLDASEAAEYIGIAAQTLAKKRVSGESPPYFKAGRKILYSREELDEWLAARRKHSTSDGFQKR